jgi:hypothetical protein
LWVLTDGPDALPANPRLENSMTTDAFEIRPATPADVPAIHEMIGLLAEYEKLSHLHVSGEADLASALFGERPAAEVLIACKKELPLPSPCFSTIFLRFSGVAACGWKISTSGPNSGARAARRRFFSAWPLWRGDRDCGRFEWAVLDWNAPAIEFYQSLGATVMPDWRIVRVVGPALEKLANGAG